MAIYRNISRKDYVALEGINASSLKPFYESSLNGNYERSKPWKTSPAMEFGTMAHSLILEGDTFDDLYCVQPVAPEELWTKQSGKDKGKRYTNKPNVVKEWEANLPKDKTYYSFEQLELLEKIKGNLDKNKNAQSILKACPNRESAITWMDEATGLKCKALLDFMGDKISGDLKTTRDIPSRETPEATANALKWEMVSNRNVLQFALYFDGLIANDIAVEKFAVIFAKNNGNCDTATAFLSDDTLNIGRNMYTVALQNWINREENASAFAELMEI
jgi:hypothetical protein